MHNAPEMAKLKHRPIEIRVDKSHYSKQEGENALKEFKHKMHKMR